ncbi:phosphatidylinositol transfer protein 1 isoform X4 [Ricinus communis]|uniref:phosphatidylinositol transfer protein 1 isoform X4 n=1 Tax=Ricinus communis TaxID=3988 RepID=UPI00201AE434|nr:phosphatidylinositol transfer protein 1 isoform X4 [Ricinus communis]XP_048234013.1 phosphatidylinositol transfer protein 1 isoform X4 [Ricinus communis]
MVATGNQSGMSGAKLEKLKAGCWEVRAKRLLGLQLLHQLMLSSCKKKLGMHTQDAKQCPYFTKFSLTVETIHRDDNGQSENVHGLSKEQLASRQVEYIDIASAATDYWSYAIGSNSIDFSKFKSLRTGRGPLLDGWQDRCKPVMTAYKLVTIDAPYWGFGYRLEQALLAGERALFLESHRNCFGWIDEWFGMSMQQLRELELQSNSSLNKKIGMTSSEGFDQRLCLDKKDTDSNRFQLKSEKHELAVDT